MSETFAGWQDVIAAARSDAEPVRALSLLSAVCLAAQSFVIASVKKERAGKFPSGAPDKRAVREAAALLCELTEDQLDNLSKSRQALGLASLMHQALRSDGDSDDDNEHTRRLQYVRRAADLATAAADDLMIAICENHVGGALRSLGRPLEAIAAHRRALLAINAIDVFGSAHWMYRDAPFLAFNAAPGVAYKVKFRAQLSIVRRLVAVPDIASAQTEVDSLVAFAYLHREVAPGPVGWALVARARVQRAASDTGGFLATEGELQALASDAHQDGSLQRYWLACVADNASHLKDFGRVEWATRQRVAARARAVLGVEIDEVRGNADDLRSLISRAYEIGSRNSLTSLGNCCYDIIKAQFFGGDLDAAPSRRAEALRVLDVADYAWRDFKGNGTHALRMMRGQIELLEDNPRLDEISQTFVTVSRKAVNENTARRALVAAVRSGVVGSAVVRARLDELLGSVDPVRAAGEFAVTMGLSAEWWFRVNVAGGSPDQLLDWAAGERAALAAVELLRPAGVSLDPELEATCWHSAALSLAAGGGGDVEQLERLLWSVRCVAELMVTVSTSSDRSRLAGRFGPVFSAAAELAVALGDHAAADVVMEAARRDRVGLILAELARNPDVDNAIRSAALAVADSSSATPAAATGDEEEDGEPPVTTSTEARSAAILVDRRGAVSDAERVLGPLGALCDASGLMSITAASVLGRRSVLNTTTAVLQLFPQRDPSGSDGADASAVRVYRRLTWIVGDGSTVEEYLDSLDVPEALMALSAGDPNTFAWSSKFATVVLPPPLLDLLQRAATNSPVRLMIVPTGLFHVPFDALPLSAAGFRGEMVVDRAVVSVHGSLTSMLALMQIDTITSIVPSIAVYGGTGLDHVETEYDALSAHLPGVIRVRGADELRGHLGEVNESEPITMLAMGVHGSVDDHGWGQGKTMPDGSIVTAAQALAWTVPRLCVLASCHSPITTADGVELGGFPLALMLRGAVTVIGGLYDIDDRATTIVMNRFWALYANGTPPLQALHQAKIAWLQENPEVRRTPRLWAGLIAYGAATQ